MIQNQHFETKTTVFLKLFDNFKLRKAVCLKTGPIGEKEMQKEVKQYIKQITKQNSPRGKYHWIADLQFY